MNWLNIAVAGGVNLDVLGSPSDRFLMKDSNVGSVRFSCGGVGHNIAAQAVRTGADVSLYTVFGNDRNAEWLKQCCHEEGIRIDHAFTTEGSSSVYLAIHDTDGDMLNAINDMRLLDAFTSDVLDGMMPFINQANVCVLDANLPEQTLIHLAESATIPLVCDPVSTVKASRILPILSHLTAIKPNLLEARAMTSCSTPEECAAKLLDSGVKNVFISLGKKGLFYANSNDQGYISPAVITLKAQTGAGDSLTAGIASGIALNESVRDCALRSMDSVRKFFHM